MKKKTVQKGLIAVVCLLAVSLFADLLGRPPICTAARLGNTAEVRRLLDQGVNIESKDIAEKTALIMAAEGGRAETVDFLLSRGANINVRNRKGGTLLFGAVAGSADVRTIEILLEHGANTEVKSELLYSPKPSVEIYLGSFTPLELASRNGRTEIVTLIQKAERDREKKAVAVNQKRVSADKQQAVKKLTKMPLEELVSEQPLDSEGFVLALTDALFEADLKKLPDYLLKPGSDPMRLRVEVKKRLAMSGIKKDEYYDKAQSLREDGKKSESVKWSNLANAIKAYQGALMSIKSELESY